MLTEMCMKETGWMIKPMVSATTITWMEQNMKVSGLKINSMARERRSGLTTLTTQVATSMVRKRDTDASTGQMALLILVIL
jgi:hypothetical protein